MLLLLTLIKPTTCRALETWTWSFWHSNPNLERDHTGHLASLKWPICYCTTLTYLLPAWLFICYTQSVPTRLSDKRQRNLSSLSARSTESVDWENNPDPLPSSPWDLPLGRGGKKRSGEKLKCLLFHLMLHSLADEGCLIASSVKLSKPRSVFEWIMCCSL